jgi:hypothetical protein
MFERTGPLRAVIVQKTEAVRVNVVKQKRIKYRDVCEINYLEILNWKFGSATRREFTSISNCNYGDGLCTVDEHIKRNNIFELKTGVKKFNTNMGLLLELGNITEYTNTNTNVIS